jgi:hypothetical protein
MWGEIRLLRVKVAYMMTSETSEVCIGGIDLCNYAAWQNREGDVMKLT